MSESHASCTSLSLTSSRLSPFGNQSLRRALVFSLVPRSHGLGVTDLSRDAMPNRLNVRVSDEELEALSRASAELSCSRSQVVRLLIHCLADGEARMGFGTVAFDYETSHGIVRNLRSIGTLYNQSVAALNTIAKVARESPDEVTAEDALETLRVVDAEMTYVADSIGCLREDVARLSDRPAVFLWS